MDDAQREHRHRCRLGGLLVVIALLGASPAGAQGAGTITGVVVDRVTGGAIANASIEAAGVTTRSDAKGQFSLRVPTGAHEVRVGATSYRTTTFPAVEVHAGASTRVEAKLSPAALAAVEVLEVVAEASTGTESTQLARRLEAPALSDAISAEIIRKLPASDAAAVAKRVPSVTIRETSDGEKVICVRGLCNRYTIGLVDGGLLPSANPVKRLVPAEIFPPEFIDSLTVYKTFLPDLRGSFSGGQVEFELRDPPDELTYSLGVASGGNSQTTFQDFKTYKGTTADWFGLGESYRSPPADVPSYSVATLRPGRVYSIARGFKDIWSVDTTTAPPDAGGKFSIGNTIGPFGFLLGGVYKNEWRRRNEVSRTAGATGDEVQVRNYFPSNERDLFATKLGGFLSTRWDVWKSHVLRFESFINRRSFDETLVQNTGKNGFITNPGPGTQVRQSQLKYLEDEVALGQFSGTHPFSWFQLEWRTALSRASRNEPDTRHTTYYKSPGQDAFRFQTDSLGGERILNANNEVLSDSSVDLTIPFETQLPWTDLWRGLPAKAKTGWAYSYRRRGFHQRRFVFAPNASSQDLTLPAEQLFLPGQIGVGGASFTESTNPTDKFKANEEILAYYGMLELPLYRDMLRVIGGARVETSTLEVDASVFRNTDAKNPAEALCPPGEAICPITIKQDNTDVLPGVSLIYSPRSDMNFRLAYNQTVSRPDFRELAPTRFPAQRGQFVQFGNISLVDSHWTGYDARWEWLFSDTEILSFGAFYKIGDQPIEVTQFNEAASEAQTWINAEQTKILGFEFEGRKNFGFLGPQWENLSLGTNVTWNPERTTNVPVAIIAGLETQQTNTKRDAVDVPSFIVNSTLEYTMPDRFTARLLYQTVGPTLVRAGALGVPDAYDERNDQLDFVLQVPLEHWIGQPITFGVSLENLLNDQIVETQGGIVTKSYTRGITVGLGFSYAPE